MRKYCLFLITLFIGFSVLGQEVVLPKPEYQKTRHIGVHFTLHDFQTAADLKAGGLSQVLLDKQWYHVSRMSPGLAVSYIEGLTEKMDFMARLGVSTVSYPIPNKTSSSGQKLLLESDASVLLKLLSDKYWVSPYMSAGLGASMWGGYFGAYIPTGLGLQVNLSEETQIHIQAQYRFPVVSGTTAAHLFYSFGITGNITKKKEVVIAPPPPPAPPKDTDNDGIYDSLDACPTVPGLAQFQGCPDTDRDGIQDKDDKCPTVAGLAQFQGCPDTDNDGIPDSEDKCPTVAGLARYNGCPIPDTDGDGINDEEDRCPTIPGVLEMKGCPKIDYTAHQVLFQSGKSTLLPAGKKELDKLVAFLEKNPDVKIALEGHTDNTGTDKINQPLSEKRAASSKAYLVSKGIAAERVETAGFGSTKPIDNNKTKTGRANNRRIEVSVM